MIGRAGHEVRLMPPAYVKPYVKRNKNDGRDAEAICEAVGRPTMRFVAVKSVEQQATMAVHTTRALLVRQRTMAANALRAALSELGIVAAPGIKGLRELMARLETATAEIPEMMRGALLVLARHWQALDADEHALERKIAQAARADGEARRLMEVPCVGPIIASTVLAKVADAKVFRSSRDFAAWIGLTGRDHGTGGKHRPGASPNPVGPHHHENLVVQQGGAADDIQVTVGHRVERAGADDAVHAHSVLPWRPPGYEPRWAYVPAARPYQKVASP